MMKDRQYFKILACFGFKKIQAILKLLSVRNSFKVDNSTSFVVFIAWICTQWFRRTKKSKHTSYEKRVQTRIMGSSEALHAEINHKNKERSKIVCFYDNSRCTRLLKFCASYLLHSSYDSTKMNVVFLWQRMQVETYYVNLIIPLVK